LGPKSPFAQKERTLSATKKTLRAFHAIQATNIQFMDNAGIQVSWQSSDAVGTIAVEASINWDPQLQTGDWIALTFDPVLAQPNSDNGEYLINLNQLPYMWFRVTYARASGSGTLNVWHCAKEV
jgi:hypothetical protein